MSKLRFNTDFLAPVQDLRESLESQPWGIQDRNSKGRVEKAAESPVSREECVLGPGRGPQVS